MRRITPKPIREAIKRFETESGNRLPLSNGFRLLTVGNTKTLKGEKKGIRTYIVHLSPERMSGRNVCPNASRSCIALCLNTAGRGRFSPIQNARIQRTRFFSRMTDSFVALLKWEIAKAIQVSADAGFEAVFRLNGTSDLPWENFGIFDSFPDVRFYDYTKSHRRMVRFLSGEMPENYHLTFSRSEDTSDATVSDILSQGGNVAVVFESMPDRFWNNLPVIDGDETDLRFLDSPGTVVGLTPKGKAKGDRSGFVVRF